VGTGSVTVAGRVEEYYAHREVRARIAEYAGGSSTTAPTAAYFATLPEQPDTLLTWDHPVRWPAHELPRLLRSSHDLARSLWDLENLIFFLDLDYHNVDAPGEAFVHPADVFLRLEPTFRATRRLFAGFGLPARAAMTGRGYHFVGAIRLVDPIVDALADLVPTMPGWFAGHLSRRPPAVGAQISKRQARASAGLGLLLEHAAHRVMRAAAPASPLPVVVNGTVVGRGPAGREAVSIDFSHHGDPLDVRHLRILFSTYQWHRVRPDIFGEAIAERVPPLVALPRHRQSPLTLLLQGRGLERAARLAGRSDAVLPDVSRGVERLLDNYRRSSLAVFHRTFLAEAARRVEPPALDVEALPPCVSAALRQPNDLLLKPEHVQHLTRGLLAQGWSAAQIAGLVTAQYEADHQWGDRWTWMHARTRAEFDVRVFAGLVATGLDRMVDFNCVSAREKGICSNVGCLHDLRIDRERTLARAGR
jgi:hypothetical protein